MMRPCLDCGVLTTRSRCPTHENQQQQARRLRRPATYAAKRDRAAVVEAWRAEHGDWCPGWRRPPHPANDLTADHVIPYVVNLDEDSELSVLCRACNSAKRDRLT